MPARRLVPDTAGYCKPTNVMWTKAKFTIPNGQTLSQLLRSAVSGPARSCPLQSALPERQAEADIFGSSDVAPDMTSPQFR